MNNPKIWKFRMIAPTPTLKHFNQTANLNKSPMLIKNEFKILWSKLICLEMPFQSKTQNSQKLSNLSRWKLQKKKSRNNNKSNLQSFNHILIWKIMLVIPLRCQTKKKEVWLKKTKIKDKKKFQGLHYWIFYEILNLIFKC